MAEINPTGTPPPSDTLNSGLIIATDSRMESSVTQSDGATHYIGALIDKKLSSGSRSSSYLPVRLAPSEYKTPLKLGWDDEGYLIVNNSGKLVDPEKEDGDGIEIGLGTPIIVKEITQSMTGIWVGFVIAASHNSSWTKNSTRLLYTRPHYLRRFASTPADHIVAHSFYNVLYDKKTPSPEIAAAASEIDPGSNSNWVNIENNDVKLAYFNFTEYNKKSSSTGQVNYTTQLEKNRHRYSEGYYYFVSMTGRRKTAAELLTQDMIDEGETTSSESTVALKEAEKTEIEADLKHKAFKILLEYLGKDISSPEYTKSGGKYKQLMDKYFVKVASKLSAKTGNPNNQKMLFAIPVGYLDGLAESNLPYRDNFPLGVVYSDKFSGEEVDPYQGFREGRDYIFSIKVSEIKDVVIDLVNIFIKLESKVDSFRSDGGVIQNTNGVDYNIQNQIKRIEQFPEIIDEFLKKQVYPNTSDFSFFSRLTSAGLSDEEDFGDDLIQFGVRDNNKTGGDVRETISFVIYSPDLKKMSKSVSPSIKSSVFEFDPYITDDELNGVVGAKRSGFLCTQALPWLRDKFIDTEGTRTLHYIMSYLNMITYSKKLEKDPELNTWIKFLQAYSVPPHMIWLSKDRTHKEEDIDCVKLIEEFKNSNSTLDEAALKYQEIIESKCGEAWQRANNKDTSALDSESNKAALDAKSKSLKRSQSSEGEEALRILYRTFIHHLDPEAIVSLLLMCLSSKYGIPTTADAICEFIMLELIKGLGIEKCKGLIVSVDPSLAPYLSSAEDAVDEALGPQSTAIIDRLEQQNATTQAQHDDMSEQELRLDPRFEGAPVSAVIYMTAAASDSGLSAEATNILLNLEKGGVGIELVPGLRKPEHYPEGEYIIVDDAATQGFETAADALFGFDEGVFGTGIQSVSTRYTWWEIDRQRETLLSDGYSNSETDALLVEAGFLEPLETQYESVLDGDAILNPLADFGEALERLPNGTARLPGVGQVSGQGIAETARQAGAFLDYLRGIADIQALCVNVVGSIMELPSILLNDPQDWGGGFENWGDDFLDRLKKQFVPPEINIPKIMLPDSMNTDDLIGDYTKKLLHMFVGMIAQVLGQLLNLMLTELINTCFDAADDTGPLGASVGELPPETVPLPTLGRQNLPAGMTPADMQGWLRDLISILSPEQLCSLFAAEASEATLDLCLTKTRVDWPKVYNIVDNKSDIATIFINLGQHPDLANGLEICDFINARPAQIDDICDGIYDYDLRCEELQLAGLTPEECDEQIRQELESFKNKIKDLAKFAFPNSNPLADALPSPCGDNGFFELPPAVEETMQSIVDNLLETTKGTLINDLSSLKFFTMPPRAIQAMSDPSELGKAHKFLSDMVKNNSDSLECVAFGGLTKITNKAGPSAPLPGEIPTGDATRYRSKTAIDLLGALGLGLFYGDGYSYQQEYNEDANQTQDGEYPGRNHMALRNTLRSEPGNYDINKNSPHPEFIDVLFHVHDEVAASKDIGEPITLLDSALDHSVDTGPLPIFKKTRKKAYPDFLQEIYNRPDFTPSNAENWSQLEFNWLEDNLSNSKWFSQSDGYDTSTPAPNLGQNYLTFDMISASRPKKNMTNKGVQGPLGLHKYWHHFNNEKLLKYYSLDTKLRDIHPTISSAIVPPGFESIDPGYTVDGDAYFTDYDHIMMNWIGMFYSFVGIAPGNTAFHRLKYSQLNRSVLGETHYEYSAWGGSTVDWQSYFEFIEQGGPAQGGILALINFEEYGTQDNIEELESQIAKAQGAGKLGVENYLESIYYKIVKSSEGLQMLLNRAETEGNFGQSRERTLGDIFLDLTVAEACGLTEERISFLYPEWSSGPGQIKGVWFAQFGHVKDKATGLLQGPGPWTSVRYSKQEVPFSKSDIRVLANSGEGYVWDTAENHYNNLLDIKDKINDESYFTQLAADSYIDALKNVAGVGGTTLTSFIWSPEENDYLGNPNITTTTSNYYGLRPCFIVFDKTAVTVPDANEMINHFSANSEPISKELHDMLNVENNLSPFSKYAKSLGYSVNCDPFRSFEFHKDYNFNPNVLSYPMPFTNYVTDSPTARENTNAIVDAFGGSLSSAESFDSIAALSEELEAVHGSKRLVIQNSMIPHNKTYNSQIDAIYDSTCFFKGQQSTPYDTEFAAYPVMTKDVEGQNSKNTQYYHQFNGRRSKLPNEVQLLLQNYGLGNAQDIEEKKNSMLSLVHGSDFSDSPSPYLPRGAQYDYNWKHDAEGIPAAYTLWTPWFEDNTINGHGPLGDYENTTNGQSNVANGHNFKSFIFGNFLTEKLKEYVTRYATSPYANSQFSDVFYKKLNWQLSTYGYSSLQYAYSNQAFSKLSKSRLNTRSFMRKLWKKILKSPLSEPFKDPRCAALFSELGIEPNNGTETDFFDLESIKPKIIEFYKNSICRDVYEGNSDDYNSVQKSMIEAVLILLIKVYVLELCFASVVAWDSFKIDEIFEDPLMTKIVIDNIKNEIGSKAYDSLANHASDIVKKSERLTDTQSYFKKLKISAMAHLIQEEASSISSIVQGMFKNSTPLSTNLSLETLRASQDDLTDVLSARGQIIWPYDEALDNINDLATTPEKSYKAKGQNDPLRYYYWGMAEHGQGYGFGQNIQNLEGDPSGFKKGTFYAAAVASNARHISKDMGMDYVMEAKLTNNIYTLNYNDGGFHSAKFTDAENCNSPPSPGEKIRQFIYGNYSRTGDPATQRNYFHSIPYAYTQNLIGPLNQGNPDIHQIAHFWDKCAADNLQPGQNASPSVIACDNAKKYFDLVGNRIAQGEYNNLTLQEYPANEKNTKNYASLWCDPQNFENCHHGVFGNNINAHLGNIVFQPYVYIEDTTAEDRNMVYAISAGDPCEQQNLEEIDVYAALGDGPFLENLRRPSVISSLVSGGPLSVAEDGSHKIGANIFGYVPLSVWSEFYNNHFLTTIENDPILKSIFQKFGMRPFFKKIKFGIRMSYISHYPAIPKSATDELGGANNLYKSYTEFILDQVGVEGVNECKTLLASRPYVVHRNIQDAPQDAEQEVTKTFILDEMHIPIVEVEREFSAELNTMNASGFIVDNKVVPYNQVGYKLPGFDNHDLLFPNESFADLQSKEEIIKHLVTNPSQFFYKNLASGLLEDLKETAEFKLMFDYLFPQKRYMASAFLYAGDSISKWVKSDDILDYTKSILISSLQAFESSNDYTYTPDEIKNSLSNEMLNMETGTRGKEDSLTKQILEIIWKTPLLILKGFVEVTDPAIIIAKLIVDIANAAASAVVMAIEQGLNAAKQITDQAIMEAKNAQVQLEGTIASQSGIVSVALEQLQPPELKASQGGPLQMNITGPAESWSITAGDLPQDIAQNMSDEEKSAYEDAKKSVNDIGQLIESYSTISETIADLEEKKQQIEDDINGKLADAKKTLKDVLQSPYTMPATWLALIPSMLPYGGGVVPPPFVVGPPSTFPGMIYLALLLIDAIEEQQHDLITKAKEDDPNCEEEL